MPLWASISRTDPHRKPGENHWGPTWLCGDCDSVKSCYFLPHQLRRGNKGLSVLMCACFLKKYYFILPWNFIWTYLCLRKCFSLTHNNAFQTWTQHHPDPCLTLTGSVKYCYWISGILKQNGKLLHTNKMLYFELSLLYKNFLFFPCLCLEYVLH